MSRLHIPEYVHGSPAAHGGSVVLNLRAGRWYALNPTAQRLWRELRRTGDFDAAVRIVAAGYPPSWAETIRADAEQLVASLTDRRLVVLDQDAKPAQPEPEARPSKPATPVIARDRVPRGVRRGRAHLALFLSLLLLRLPFRWTVWLVSTVRRRWCRADATVLEIAGALVAIEEAAQRYPGRAACLEHSLGAVLTAALCRRRVDWAIGIAEDPYRFHAWVEAEGVPVLPSPEPDFGEFRRVLTL